MRPLTAATLIAALAGGQALVAETPSAELEALQSLSEVRHHRLISEHANHTYLIYVRLPPGYEGGEASLPVVYLLDGGVTFPLFAGYQRYLELSEEAPAAILVGISYGTSDWEDGNNRSHDFTAPSDEREHWGGAADFQKMLAEELLPWVEREFRADPTRRAIFGQSLGGQFVLYTALTRPRLFWGHIASNPALHRNLEFFLRPAAAAPGEPSRLFVASASADAGRFRGPAVEWMAHWEATRPRPWALRTATLDGHTHFSAAPEAYRQGMSWLFASQD